MQLFRYTFFHKIRNNGENTKWMYRRGRDKIILWKKKAKNCDVRRHKKVTLLGGQRPFSSWGEIGLKVGHNFKFLGILSVDVDHFSSDVDVGGGECRASPIEATGSETKSWLGQWRVKLHTDWNDTTFLSDYVNDEQWVNQDDAWTTSLQAPTRATGMSCTDDWGVGEYHLAPTVLAWNVNIFDFLINFKKNIFTV